MNTLSIGRQNKTVGVVTVVAIQRLFVNTRETIDDFKGDWTRYGILGDLLVDDFDKARLFIRGRIRGRGR